MGIDLSRLRRGNDHDRRPWHGAAFIVEALVLLVFLIASLAVIMQVIAGAHERSIEADRLVYCFRHFSRSGRALYLPFQIWDKGRVEGGGRRTTSWDLALD
ncbi:hypothetical protein C1861_12840, partial [Eggerthella lenta]